MRACVCIDTYIHTSVQSELIDDRRYDEDADRILKVIEALKVGLCVYVFIYTYIHMYIQA